MDSQPDFNFAFLTGLRASGQAIHGEEFDAYFPTGSQRIAHEGIAKAFHERAEAFISRNLIVILADAGNTYRAVQHIFIPLPEEVINLFLGQESARPDLQFEQIADYLPTDVILTPDEYEVFGYRSHIIFTPERIVVLWEGGNQYCRFDKVFIPVP